MSLEFIAGTSGRIRSVLVTPSTTSDMPPGFNGTAVTPGTRAIVAEVKSWKFSDSVSSEAVHTFENPASAQGVVYPINLRGGISSGVKIEVSGFYNAMAGNATHTEFQIGGFVFLDAMYHKNNSFGYGAMLCKVTSYSSGGSMGAAPFDFSCSLELQGVPPIPAVIT